MDGHHYCYRDHLGNLRLSFRDSSAAPVGGVYKPPVLVQANDYDPWGLDISSFQQNNRDNFKYSGKERITDFNLGWDNFGARMYDAAIGRWSAVDPLAYKRDWLTPYNFCQNNPVNRIDPLGLTDFTLNRKTGEVKQVGEANDQPDRILRTNNKGEVKYRKNGEAKVAVGGIEQGILKDGQNFKAKDQVISVGGKGQPSVEGVKSFTLQLSEYTGNEIKGYSYSSNGSENVTDMVLGGYKNNTNTKSYGTPLELRKKYGDNFSDNNILQDFHTHPDGKLGATQSDPNISQDVKGLQRDKPKLPNASFIILYRIMGQIKPAEYDYTHENRP